MPHVRFSRSTFLLRLKPRSGGAFLCAYPAPTGRQPLFPKRVGVQPAGARGAVIASAERPQLGASWQCRHFQTIAKPAGAPSRSRSSHDDCSGHPAVLAATNKCLAQGNKSSAGREATNSVIRNPNDPCVFLIRVFEVKAYRRALTEKVRPSRTASRGVGIDFAGAERSSVPNAPSAQTDVASRTAQTRPCGGGCLYFCIHVKRLEM